MKPTYVLQFIITAMMALPVWAVDQTPQKMSKSSSGSLATSKPEQRSERERLSLHRDLETRDAEGKLSLDQSDKPRAEKSSSSGQGSLREQGGVAGGGGHYCKSQVQQFVANINAVFSENPSLESQFPEWATMAAKLDPKKNPKFTIRISQRPIQNCPQTENALACSHPRENILDLYCGENGWNSLDLKEKYKQVIHELYWWYPQKDDRNYFYSSKMSDEIFELMPMNASVQQHLVRFGKGDVTSAETMLNGISVCEPDRTITYFSGGWTESNGQLTCNELADHSYGLAANGCALKFKYSYSVILNKKFSEEVTAESPNILQGSLPIGTIFSDKICKDKIRQNFKRDSLDRLTYFDQLNNGEILKEIKGKTTTCYQRIFRATYDPSSGEIGDSEGRRLTVPCP